MYPVVSPRLPSQRVVSRLQAAEGSGLTLPEHVSKPFLAVQESVDGCEPGLAGHLRRFSKRIFLGYLHMQRLVLPERERVVANMYFLYRQTNQVAFAGAAAGIVDRIMLEFVRIEIGAQLAIDPVKQIEVKRPGNALMIIVRIED